MRADAPFPAHATPAWHALPGEAVVDELQTDAVRGLPAAEIAARRARFGPNALPPPRRRGPWLRFALQFHNPLIYVLLAAGAAELAGRRSSPRDRDH